MFRVCTLKCAESLPFYWTTAEPRLLESLPSAFPIIYTPFYKAQHSKPLQLSLVKP